MLVHPVNFSYRAVPTISRFNDSRAYIKGLMGPFGSGKSTGCVFELLDIAREQPPGPGGIRRSRFAVIRNTYPQLNDTTIRTWMSWLPEHVFGRYNKTDHVYVMDRLEAGLEVEVMFRALDRPDHVSNLLSLELTAAWINEAREVPWAIIQAIQGRIGRFPGRLMGGCKRACLIMDTNPPDDDSWWYELFEEKRPDNAQLFKQPSGLAPDAENIENLPENYYLNLLKGSDEAFVKVYIKGEYGYVQDGKPVYPEYIDSLHCTDADDYRPGLPVYRGWDFGLSPACVLSQVTPEGRWNTFDEFTGDSISMADFADTVILGCNQRYPHASYIDIGDPAGQSRSATVKETDESSCFAILRAKSIAIEPGEQTLTLRLESVRKPMNTLLAGKPQLQVHPRAKMLRKGYQGRYKYKRVQVSGSDRYHDLPDKNSYSHPHDANQYVAARLFGAGLKSASSKPLPKLKYRKLGIV